MADFTSLTDLAPDRLDRLRDHLRERDWRELTTEELAQAVGLSRMTLHRRGIGKEVVLAQLGRLLEAEYHEALLPALVSAASGADRLRLALESLCAVSERYLGVLDALGGATAVVFHDEGDGPVMTRVTFTDGLSRILEDGIADGTLRAEDPAEMATLLFNATGWTYRHMRTGHRWEPEHARDSLVGLLLDGVAV
jgi:AcrR family transcriptional regulator